MSRYTSVVYQDRTSSGYVLKSWSVRTQHLVSEVLAGSSEPRPSDLNGYTFFDDGRSASVLKWDPAEPPDNPDGPPHGPFPVQSVPLFPNYHDCNSLHEMKVGPYFGLVRGDNCGPARNLTRLYLVPRDENRFVMNWSTMAYQPFVIDTAHEIDPGLPLQYALQDRYFAFFDSAQRQVRAFEIDTARIMPIESPTSPRDNDSMNPTPLAPWNHGSWGEGYINYEKGGRSDFWKAYLSANQKYHIIIYAQNDPLCGENRWEHDVMMNVRSADGQFQDTIQTNEARSALAYDFCPTVEIQPNKSQDYVIEVFRPIAWVEGNVPPLEYEIYIDVR